MAKMEIARGQIWTEKDSGVADGADGKDEREG